MTLMTAAVVAVFTKVYDSSEKQAAMAVELQILAARVDSLDRLLDIERIENARTRATCDKWIREVKRMASPD